METCPACQSDKANKIEEKNSFAILVCHKCKSIYVAELSTQPQSFSYGDYYTETNLTIPSFVHQRLDEIVTEFVPFRKNNRFLDVGCGAGAFLLAAKKAGWDAEGVEVSKSSVEHTCSQGLKSFHGTLQEASFRNEYFDVIVAMEVLEHVTEPQLLVEEVYSILRPGGLFWGTTPHGRGFSVKAVGKDWSIIAPPEHLQLFSTSGIKHIFKQSGFSQVKVVTNGVNLFEALYIWQRRLSNFFEKKDIPENNEQNFNRVQSSYELNETFSKTPLRKRLKNILNGILNLFRLGDSIKFWAIK